MRPQLHRGGKFLIGIRRPNPPPWIPTSPTSHGLAGEEGHAAPWQRCGWCWHTAGANAELAGLTALVGSTRGRDSTVEREKTHTMNEIMEILRRDLAVVPALFAPARYTTMVEGRPVQAQRLNLSTICNLMLLAWSLHFHAKVQTCRVTVHSVAAVAHPSLGQRLR